MNRTTRQATRTAVAAQGLHKTYGDTKVLDGVDLSVGEGEVFALLGPNGAGKTTTVKILSTLIPADAGTASVLGHDLRREGDAVRAAIGVTGQFSAVADWLTDRIAVVDHGRIVAEGTPEELKRRIPGAHISLRFVDAESLGAAAKALPEGTRDDEELVLRVPNEGGIASLRDVLARLGDGVAVEDLSIHTPDLDDVFFALTGNPAKEQTR